MGRIDLMAEAGATAFYDTLSHHTMPGYRIYPAPVPGGY
jgi:hypothetical protein